MRISDWSSDVCSSDLQAQAALRQAQIDLRYTDVIAPIAGRIGRSAFTSGALVGPDSGPLALVVSQNPIHVTFPVTQREILAVRRRMQETGESPERAVVRLVLADGPEYPEAGHIDRSEEHT